MSENKEGWADVPEYSTKFHYFVDDRSLCRKFGYVYLLNGPLNTGNDDSLDNCLDCKRKLIKRRINDKNMG